MYILLLYVVVHMVSLNHLCEPLYQKVALECFMKIYSLIAANEHISGHLYANFVNILMNDLILANIHESCILNLL